MNLLLVAMLATGFQQTGSTIFEQVILKPTGANGYEEYCRAADLISTTEFVEMSLAATDPNRSGTLLDARRAISNKFFMVFDLVAAGNRKKVYDPRTELDFNTRFPELGRFKEIFKLFCHRIYVQLANGNGAGAVSTYIEGVKFSAGIAQQTIISLLMSVTLRDLISYELLPYLTSISLADASRIEATMDALLSAEPKTIGIIGREERMLTENLSDFLKEIPTYGHLDEETQERFSAMDDRARKALADQVRPAIKKHYDALAQTMRGPEKEWSVPDPENLYGDAKVVFESLTPAFEQMLKREATDRTKLRLWRLAMRIVQFRWLHNRLPKDLAELQAQALTSDPANGGEFVYRTFEMQFEISSRGSSLTGPIKMGRVIPPSGDSGL